jgi:hypothetical protein
VNYLVKAKVVKVNHKSLQVQSSGWVPAVVHDVESKAWDPCHLSWSCIWGCRGLTQIRLASFDELSLPRLENRDFRNEVEIFPIIRGANQFWRRASHAKS